MWNNIETIFELFPDAVIAGVVIAASCAFLGVFVILKRVSFIGIALSQVAAAGIAASLLFGFPPLLCAAPVTLFAVTILSYPFDGKRIPRDAVLGITFVAASAASTLIVARSAFDLNEVKALLYGDLILTSHSDLIIIIICLLPAVLLQILFFRPTVLTFLDRDNAKVTGIRVAFWELLFFYCLGLTVAASCKVTGSILVFCYLTVPPVAGLLVSKRLIPAIVVSVIVAVLSTLIGIYISFKEDFPTNQVICVSSLIFLAVAWIGRFLFSLRRKVKHV
ncbi:MAG: iron chelate uptake ABC transporter family permease subunit [Planctomycetota bacterium]